MQTELKIKGMTCGHCVAHVTKTLQEVPGVQSADVKLEEGSAVVQHQNADVQAMLTAVDDAGFEAEINSAAS
jgi:copper chaperone CopZ